MVYCWCCFKPVYQRLTGERTGSLKPSYLLLRKLSFSRQIFSKLIPKLSLHDFDLVKQPEETENKVQKNCQMCQRNKKKKPQTFSFVL